MVRDQGQKTREHCSNQRCRMNTGKPSPASARKKAKANASASGDSGYITDPKEWVDHKAKAVAISRILRKRPKAGKRYENLQLLSLAEATLGYGTVKLSHPFVTEALIDAQAHEDWAFLKALHDWHTRRKPLQADRLQQFLADNFNALKGLIDQQILESAKKAGVKDATLFRVRDARLMLTRVTQDKRQRERKKPSSL